MSDTSQKPPTTPGKRGFLVGVGTLATVGCLLFIVLLIFSIWLLRDTSRVRAEGYAMAPSLQDGDLLIVDKLAYQKQPPQRGDIIVFYYPGLPRQTLVKRVIGLPGENIKVQDGQVLIDDLPIVETYLAAPPAYRGEWVVEKDEYFVLGDNRNDSSDSHSWGFLPAENIIGKVIWIYWPPADWGSIPPVDYQP